MCKESCQLKKLLITLLIISLVLITACSPDEAENDIDTPPDSSSEPSTTSDADEVNTINMQSYTLTVPSNYELLKGGHDGVKYNNAILKPKDSSAYEIELDFGIFFINSVDIRKETIRIEYGATTFDVSTEEYVQNGVAYTYTFTHDTRGTVQAIELVTGDNPVYYMRGYIDVEDDQGVNDPVDVLSSFIAKNIVMKEIKAD